MNYPAGIVIGRNLVPYNDLQLVGGITQPLQLLRDVPIIYAVLGGISESGAKAASFTPGGALRTAETGAGFSREAVFEGTVMNNTVVVTFPSLVMSIVINCDTFQATFAHSLDGVVYDPPKTILAGEKFSADILTKSIRVVNTSGVTATGYRIWGLYYPQVQPTQVQPGM